MLNEVRQRRGEGGLQKKKGKYEGRFRVYKVNGDYIEKSFTRGTITEINDIKAELRVLGTIDEDVIEINIDKHTNKITLIKNTETSLKYKVNKDISVVDYVDYWLWNHRRKGEKGQRIKDSTFEDYVQKGSYIKEILGTMTLSNGKEIRTKMRDLTFDFIEEKLLEFHSRIAHVTAVQVRNHIYNMMKYAKKDGIIKENPFSDDTINFPESEKKEKQIIKEKDINLVIKQCLKLWYIDVLVQLMTGARVGEIRGLKWEDINLETCEISFNNGYNAIKEFKLDENNHIVSLGRKRQYSSLKTKSSKRTIVIDKELVKVLILHKEMQKRLAERLEIPFKETDAVFTTATYTPYSRNDTNDRVKKIMKDIKIENWENITSHCLRHSFCYAGLLNDVPLEYMQLLLGHANISVTREWYAHFDKSKIDKYAKKVNSHRTQILKELEHKNHIAV